MNTYIWKTKEPINTKNNKRVIGLYAGRTKMSVEQRVRGCAFSGNQWCRPIGGDEVKVLYQESYTQRSLNTVQAEFYTNPLGLYEELLIQTLYRYIRNLQDNSTGVSVEILNVNRGTKFSNWKWEYFTDKMNRGRNWNAHALGIIRKKI